MRPTAAALTAALWLATPSARAEDKPTSPTVFFALGGTSLALGVANLGTAPLCYLDIIRSSARLPCALTSVAFGAAFVATGIPLIVTGVRRRAALPPVDVVPVAGGAAMVWSGQW